MHWSDQPWRLWIELIESSFSEQLGLKYLWNIEMEGLDFRFRDHRTFTIALWPKQTPQVRIKGAAGCRRCAELWKSDGENKTGMLVTLILCFQVHDLEQRDLCFRMIGNYIFQHMLLIPVFDFQKKIKVKHSLTCLWNNAERTFLLFMFLSSVSKFYPRSFLSL